MDADGKKLVLLTWDGGGNVTVTVGVAVALQERGHRVTVLGPRSLQRGVESQGLGYAELGVLPPRDSQQRLAYLLDVTVGTDGMLDRLRRVAADADALVVDCNLSWALESPVARRTAVLVHTALGIYLPAWQAVLDAANQQRAAARLAPLLTAAEAWSRSDLLLVASIPQFDRPLPSGRLRPIYVGPVQSGGGRQASYPARPPEDGRPRVLISYSTDGLQNNPQRVQTALDGLAGLPVGVLATTSGAFPRSALRVPANASVVDYVSHGSVMATFALVVCHAGHGTTMAALSHGVPMVCIPGSGRDQEPIAARVSELGLGIALEREASAGIIRDAVSAILADGCYLERAREFAKQAGRPDGAQRAALELLALVDESV